MIRLRNDLKMSFESKSDYSPLHNLPTTLFLKKFKINLESLISENLTYYPKVSELKPSVSQTMI